MRFNRCIKFIIILPGLTLALYSKAQTFQFKSNISDSEKLSSPIYKNLSGRFDLVIAYARESYWWENKEIYDLLAVKGDVCLKGYFYSRKRKNGSWSKPRIKFVQVNKDSANNIVKQLNDGGFFFMNRDSLNINRKRINDKQDEVFSVSDGVNYRFEILRPGSFTVIESYEPEYFLEKMPELKSRETFIKYRDWFVQKYKNLQ